MADFNDEGMDVEDPMEMDVAPPVLVENTSLDLESYIVDYAGRSRFRRLAFVAVKCPQLKVEALRLALDELKTDQRPALVQEIAAALKSSAPSDNVTVPNDAMVKEESAQVVRQRESLELTLKQCRANKVKESIRTAYTELGDHLYRSGDLSTAMKTYQRCRDYSTSSEHVINMCQNVIKVALELPNWSHLLSYVTKAEGAIQKDDKNAPNQTETQKKNPLITELRCYAALAQLAMKSYETAATLFLSCAFDDAVMPHLISRKDVATYGALCALASFSRSVLKDKIIDNPGFKEFLELVPEIRELVKQYYASQYATCLTVMDKIKSDLQLDLYLADHVEFLYKRIRDKMLTQYFSPFLSVDMSTMAQQFNTSVNDLEGELSELIAKKTIQARIDSDKKVLHARKVDQRVQTFKHAIEVGKSYKIHMQAILLRAAMTKANISVTGTGRTNDRNDQGRAEYMPPSEPDV